MVPKGRIDRPKLCFRVIRPRIIFHHVRDQFYFGLPSLFLFISTHCFFVFRVSFQFIFLLYFFQHFCFAFAHFYFFSGVSSTSFRTPISSHLPLITRYLNIHNSQRISFFVFAPNVRVIFGRGIEGNYQAQRGDYRIIFISVKGL